MEARVRRRNPRLVAPDRGLLGPLGSRLGQVHFREGLVVREEQGSVALYTPQYGLFEVRYRAVDDPANMVALWMIGFGDTPTRSAEICVAEIFGRDVGAETPPGSGWAFTRSGPGDPR